MFSETQEGNHDQENLRGTRGPRRTRGRLLTPPEMLEGGVSYHFPTSLRAGICLIYRLAEVKGGTGNKEAPS